MVEELPAEAERPTKGPSWVRIRSSPPSPPRRGAIQRGLGFPWRLAHMQSSNWMRLGDRISSVRPRCPCAILAERGARRGDLASWLPLALDDAQPPSSGLESVHAAGRRRAPGRCSAPSTRGELVGTVQLITALPPKPSRTAAQEIAKMIVHPRALGASSGIGRAPIPARSIGRGSSARRWSRSTPAPATWPSALCRRRIRSRRGHSRLCLEPGRASDPRDNLYVLSDLSFSFSRGLPGCFGESRPHGVRLTIARRPADMHSGAQGTSARGGRARSREGMMAEAAQPPRRRTGR